jgi:SAM-dependent methyltransferase
VIPNWHDIYAKDFREISILAHGSARCARSDLADASSITVAHEATACVSFCDAGFAATGFEISRPRARFGAERLGVRIIDSEVAVSALDAGSFDLIFSNHVIEHLPHLGKSFELFARLLTPAGLLFAIIPNFTGRVAREGLFWSWIGQDHPIAPSHRFLGHALLEHGFEVAHFGSSPFDQSMLTQLRAGQFDRLDRDGDELLILAWTPRAE